MPHGLPQALPDMVVGDMMRRWPQTVPVLLRHRMSCPGCLMAPFMTVAEAAEEHGVEPEVLIRDLAAAIEPAEQRVAEQGVSA
ncbi:MAG: DUF1858 domain-containing protein [Tistlia sp.]|uniref:DUF1858 domain-containing protein n=1 Tax=Tistlia sp. TaxID=3057121 RepID=UPI0034A57F78